MHSKVSEWLPRYIRPRDRFSRHSKWLDTFRTVLYEIKDRKKPRREIQKLKQIKVEERESSVLIQR